MSVSTDLMRDRVLNRKDRLKKTSIKQMIINNYLNDNRYDLSIYKYFYTRRDLVEKVCSDGIWEETREGFEARNNFAYDAKSGEIVFTRNRIIKKGNKYYCNDTELAKKHLKEMQETLDSIAKVDRIIYAFYEIYKEGIERDLPKEENPTIEERRMELFIDYDLKATKRFIAIYGDLGLTALIRWLNALSSPYETTEQILKKFLVDTNETDLCFETIEDPMYQDAKLQGLEFEKELLKELVKYSPRGNKLKSLYLTKKRREKGVIK